MGNRSDGRSTERFGRAVFLAAALGLVLSPLAGAEEAAPRTAVKDAGREAETRNLSLDEVRARFEEVRSRGGPPRISDLMSLCRPNNGVVIAVKDQPAAFQMFLKMQNPLIKKEDLAVLQQVVRESIHDVRVVYRVRAEGIDRLGHTVKIDETHEFGASEGKVLCRRHGRGADGVDEDRVTAYDGTVVRAGILRSDGVRDGTIDQFQGRNMFWDVESNPLGLAMLVDTARDMEMISDYHDMIRLLNMSGLGVFEERRPVGGASCVLFGEPALLIYLDPERNFALARFESSDVPFDGPVRKRLTRTLSDFQDMGNGLWLPRTILVEEFGADEKPRLRREVTVREWHVNEGIPDRYFREVIPKGALVVDAIRGTVFPFGRRGSISELLATATPPPKRQRFRWMLLASNLVIVTGIVVLIARRRRTGVKEALS